MEYYDLMGNIFPLLVVYNIMACLTFDIEIKYGNFNSLIGFCQGLNELMQIKH